MNIIQPSNLKTTTKPNETLQFAKPSFSRFILHALEKIGDIFGSWISFARTSCGSFLSKDLKGRVTELRQSNHDGQTIPAISELESNRQLETAAITAIATRVNKTANSTTSVVTSYIFPNQPDEQVPDRNTVIIPLILKKRSRRGEDHIVTVIVNKEQNSLTYYDPKGYTVAERSKEVLITGQVLEECLEEIGNNHLNRNREITLLENTHKNQYDYHNCGVYAATTIMQIATQDRETYNPNLSALSLRTHLIEYIAKTSLPQSAEHPDAAELAKNGDDFDL